MLIPSVLLAITCGARQTDILLTAPQTTLPEDSEVWREDLPLKVYWSKQPSEELKAGFSDTVEVLGFNYENVDSVEDANIRICLVLSQPPKSEEVWKRRVGPMALDRPSASRFG